MQFREIRLGDPCYPVRVSTCLGLRTPERLWVAGNIELLRKKAIAIVGTRHPTKAGLQSARSYAALAARKGCTVISGNAPGIDSAAHSEALQAGGTTIVCPPSPPDLFQSQFQLPDDLSRLLIISPFSPGSVVDKSFFLKRNAIVAAHGHVTIVAETGFRGGTLNTVGHVRRFGLPLLVIDFPKEHRAHSAHRMLLAGEAHPIPPNADEEALINIESLLRRPLKSLDQGSDLFRYSERDDNE